MGVPWPGSLILRGGRYVKEKLGFSLSKSSCPTQGKKPQLLCGLAVDGAMGHGVVES